MRGSIKPIDQGLHSRQAVLETILRSPGISRTALAEAVGLNIASVSRITRNLIEAGLIVETESYGPSDRPGRRFVGLKPRGEGGYVIGIAINAFSQTVTLADLSNSKIDEWVSPEALGPNGDAFLRSCLAKAAEMVATHVADRRRLLGVGIAVAGEVNAPHGLIQTAPLLGWSAKVDVARLVDEILGVPFVLSTPPKAMNVADADIGLGQDIRNLATLNCSLGYGIGVRWRSDTGGTLEYGRIITESKMPGGGNLPLSHSCGGRAVLRQTHGSEMIKNTPDSQLGLILMDLIKKSEHDAELQDSFRQTGNLAARHLALIIELCRPDRLLLVGPMVESVDFIEGFRMALADALAGLTSQPEVVCSDMTPARASRWLALKGNLATAVQSLDALATGQAA